MHCDRPHKIHPFTTSGTPLQWECLFRKGAAHPASLFLQSVATLHDPIPRCQTQRPSLIRLPVNVTKLRNVLHEIPSHALNGAFSPLWRIEMKKPADLCHPGKHATSQSQSPTSNDPRVSVIVWARSEWRAHPQGCPQLSTQSFTCSSLLYCYSTWNVVLLSSLRSHQMLAFTSVHF